MAAYTFVPGAVAADTATTLPADAPKFASLTSVAVQTEAAGGTASTTSPVQATIITSGTPAAGQMLYNPATRQWTYGTATTAGTVFTFVGKEYGERPTYS
jgi:hypothetical protein